MSAIHGAINTLDALTTSYLGKRTSGEHTDALAMIKGILNQREYAETAKQFSSLLSLKNASEYQPDLMIQSDAERAVKWAERIIGRVEEKLQGLKNSWMVAPRMPKSRLNDGLLLAENVVMSSDFEASEYAS